jgi:phage tail-like protein
MFNNLTTYLLESAKHQDKLYNIVLYYKTPMTADNTTWPLPKFHFRVDFGTTFLNVLFQEVSGLETEQIIEYHHSSSPEFATIKMPGIVKYGNVTLKRGIFTNDNNFWMWHNRILMNTIQRGPVAIRLIDADGTVKMTWKLNNAWPTKVTSTDLKSDGNEVAVDSIEIVFEGPARTDG